MSVRPYGTADDRQEGMQKQVEQYRRLAKRRVRQGVVAGLGVMRTVNYNTYARPSLTLLN